MTAIHDPGVEIHESNPDQFGQYLLRTYHDSHGVTRTVAWRQSPGDTYGPEHILFPTEQPIPYALNERKAAEMHQ